jgi:hypothetical protein
MATEAIQKMRDRIRQQAAQAHTEDVTAPDSTALTQAAIAPTPVVAEPTSNVARPSAKAPRRRRSSPWTNPYPDAMPFQTSVYLTNDDLELIKELRLKLHFSREWMVLKYALEKLKVDLEKRNSADRTKLGETGKGGKHGNKETA